MKRLLNAIICLAGFLSSLATPGPGPKAAVGVLHSNSNMVMNGGAARFQFKNLIAGMESKDSILIIFDRYDHTGAGIVYRVFAADQSQGITVSLIPPGKYYVTIECIGLHRDHLEKIVTIRPQRSEMVRVKLALVETFSRAGVVIPEFHPDPADLAEVRIR